MKFLSLSEPHIKKASSVLLVAKFCSSIFYCSICFSLGNSLFIWRCICVQASSVYISSKLKGNALRKVR